MTCPRQRPKRETIAHLEDKIVMLNINMGKKRTTTEQTNMVRILPSPKSTNTAAISSKTM